MSESNSMVLEAGSNKYNAIFKTDNGLYEIRLGIKNPEGVDPLGRMRKRAVLCLNSDGYVCVFEDNQYQIRTFSPKPASIEMIFGEIENLERLRNDCIRHDVKSTFYSNLKDIWQECLYRKCVHDYSEMMTWLNTLNQDKIKQYKPVIERVLSHLKPQLDKSDNPALTNLWIAINYRLNKIPDLHLVPMKHYDALDKSCLGKMLESFINQMPNGDREKITKLITLDPISDYQHWSSETINKMIDMLASSDDLDDTKKLNALLGVIKPEQYKGLSIDNKMLLLKKLNQSSEPIDNDKLIILVRGFSTAELKSIKQSREFSDVRGKDIISSTLGELVQWDSDHSDRDNTSRQYFYATDLFKLYCIDPAHSSIPMAPVGYDRDMFLRRTCTDKLDMAGQTLETISDNARITDAHPKSVRSLADIYKSISSFPDMTTLETLASSEPTAVSSIIAIHEFNLKKLTDAVYSDHPNKKNETISSIETVYNIFINEVDKEVRDVGKIWDLIEACSTVDKTQDRLSMRAAPLVQLIRMIADYDRTHPNSTLLGLLSPGAEYGTDRIKSLSDVIRSHFVLKFDSQINSLKEGLPEDVTLGNIEKHIQIAKLQLRRYLFSDGLSGLTQRAKNTLQRLECFQSALLEDDKVSRSDASQSTRPH